MRGAKMSGWEFYLAEQHYFRVGRDVDLRGPGQAGVGAGWGKPMSPGGPPPPLAWGAMQLEQNWGVAWWAQATPWSWPGRFTG